MSKNIVNAPINVGGNSFVGDGNILNFIDGLEILIQDYREQLTNISKLINEFKPKTALGLLDDLESRIREKEITQKELLVSKILYLKGLCKSEIESYKREDSAIDFVKAYNINKNDITFRNRACIEYLNLQENEKSNSLADEILMVDEFNFAAWYVKCILSDNLFETLKAVPKILIQNSDFINSLIYRIIREEGFSTFEDLKKYNIIYKFDIGEFKTLTYKEKLKWIINIDILVNKFFAEFPLRYISGDKLIVENNLSLKNALHLLEIYVSTLNKTELSDSVTTHKFYYHYLKYLINNDENDYLTLFEVFNNLQEIHWTFVVCLCQVLNHNKKFGDALEVLEKYKDTGGEIIPEYYIFKAVVLYDLKKYNDVEKIFLDFLELYDSLDERAVLNLFYTFLNIQKNYADKALFKKEYEELLKKRYDFPELQELAEVTIKINFLDEDGEDVKKQLQEINLDSFSLIGCKILMIRNYGSLGLRLEAINRLEGFIDKTKISEELHLYIHFLIEQLYDKNDSQRRYEELRELLRFWRENSDYVDEQLLIVEHNLFMDIDDLENLEIIDTLLHRFFPESEQYLFFILSTLDRKKEVEKMFEIAKTLKTSFENEILGVNIVLLLSKNNINISKAFSILYQLAQDKSNINARRRYITNSFLFNDYFKRYEEARIGNWVSYKVENVINKLKLTSEKGFQGKFIGKKIRDKFSETTNMSNRIKTIEILEVYNDAVSLFREISEEAHNPFNELGFESLVIPEKIEDFESFLVNQFGLQGNEEKKFKDEQLNDYNNCRIGFAQITRAVFQDDFIEAYVYLTNNNKTRFTTMPSSLTSNLVVSDFGLDYSTVLLFYFLEKELKFKFLHSFKIPFLIKEYVENKIRELRVSPVSTLSVNITLEGVEKFFFPENVNEKRIEFLESVLIWINNNCEVDLIEEKLEFLPKLRQNEADFNSEFMKNILDSYVVSTRENFRLISSDTFLFIQKHGSKIYNNQLNPEKYLRTYYPDKCDEEFYRQLLKWNYHGIDINLNVLKNEFFDFLGGKENFYTQAIENLQFSVNANSNIIYTCSKFLKEIYLLSSITIESKNRYALDVVASSFNQMSGELIANYEALIKGEFKLLGNYYDEVLKVFKDVKRLYRIN